MSNHKKNALNHYKTTHVPWALILRDAVTRAGLSETELASLTHQSVGTIVRVLRGDDRVVSRRIFAVARALGLKTNLVFSPEDGEGE